MTNPAKASRVEAPADWLKPRARFFGSIPASYLRLNRRLLSVAGAPRADPAIANPGSFRAAATTLGLDQAVKILPLPAHLPADLSAAAIRGMERLRELGLLTVLRGDRPTDLARPVAPEIAATVRSQAPGLVDLIERVEGVLRGGRLFIRAVKLDLARASTTTASRDPSASNLHFDAERSSLEDYPGPIFQFYLNAGGLERQFQILPVERQAILASADPSARQRLPLEALLKIFLARHRPPLETIPIESGALAVFDGRQFAHDAGKGDVEALAGGRFVPSGEPDFVLALDTIETGYHQGHYLPEVPFLDDHGP